jgi:hypothetical protein
LVLLRRRTMRKKWIISALFLPLLAACGNQTDLDTRTFAISHLRPHEAATLIDPYVYGDREGAPGTLSAGETAITVRETPDNLEKIARVLAEYDVPRSDVRLRFQLIEANGFTDSDPAIADVEAELRKVFQFRGYRLGGEAVVTVTDGSHIEQALAGSDGFYSVEAVVYWAQADLIRLDNVRLASRGPGGVGLTTTVNIRPGQTLVLGSSSRYDSPNTILLTVSAEAVDG